MTQSDTPAALLKKLPDSREQTSPPHSEQGVVVPSGTLIEQLYSQQSEQGVVLLFLVAELLKLTVSSDTVILALGTAIEKAKEAGLGEPAIQSTVSGVREFYRNNRQFPEGFGG